MTGSFERDNLRVWATKKAAENNARKITAEFAAVGEARIFLAVKKTNGLFTVAERAQK